MKSKINFHLHTKHSDGLDSVAEVVEGLKGAGVEYFSVTDHDCIDGCEEAERLAFEQGLKFVNGVELSCCFENEADGIDFTYVAHILGYGFDIGKMSNALNRFRMQKYASLKQLFDKLVSDGYALRKEKCFKKVPINYRHVGSLALSKGNEFEIIEMENRERFAVFNFEDGVVTERKAIAKELVELGAVESVNAAFNKILNVSPYVQYAKCLPSIKDGIEAIHKCGGVAVAAHPLSTARGGKHELKTSQAEQYIDKLYQYGIDGLEVFYQGYDKKQIEFLDGQADKFGLIKSISTDYHGMDKQKMESDESYKQMLNRKGNYFFAFEKDGIEPCENITDFLVCNDGKYKEHM